MNLNTISLKETIAPYSYRCIPVSVLIVLLCKYVASRFQKYGARNNIYLLIGGI